MDGAFDYSDIEVEDYEELESYYQYLNKKGSNDVGNKNDKSEKNEINGKKENQENIGSSKKNEERDKNEESKSKDKSNIALDSLISSYPNIKDTPTKNDPRSTESVVDATSPGKKKSRKKKTKKKEAKNISSNCSILSNGSYPLNSQVETIRSEREEHSKPRFKNKKKKEKEKDKCCKCRYCDIDSFDSVVQCNNCNRWFCNGSYGTCGSHIVTHLVRSKHKEVKLHERSMLGETILECYNCGCKNVFLLGYLPTAQEGVVVIICRDPCLVLCNLVTGDDSSSVIGSDSKEVSQNGKCVEDCKNTEAGSSTKKNAGTKEKKDKSHEKGKKEKKEDKDEENLALMKTIKEGGWDLKAWRSLIEDRTLVDWLVTIPSAEEMEKKGKCTTTYNVNRLEELWKNKKDVYIEELDAEVVNDEPNKVELQYKDAVHYESIFGPLVKLEAEYDKSVKEGQKQENVTVRWDVGLNKKRYAHFIYIKEESELRLVVGDELKLSYTYSNGNVWSCQGHIYRLHNTEEIALELRTMGSSHGPWDQNITTGFTVEFVWKSTAYDRMLRALKEFSNNTYSLSGYLYYKLLGHDISDRMMVHVDGTPNMNKASIQDFEKEMIKKVNSIRNYSAPNLALLNHSQIDAIKKALMSPLSLIQGPPGTGKTLTCATLVYHLSKMNLGKVLVTAPSNVAVDQLAVRIHRTGLKVVRLCAKSREAVPSVADYLYLHNQVKLLKVSISEELNKLLELKEEVGELSEKDEERLKQLVSLVESKILQSADVICTTCVGAMDKRLSRFRFRQVLVDEATQSTEPECLVPLVTGAKQIVLVGDHCQLGPIIVCKKAANAGLGRSLFERLVLLGITPFRLEVQYRMHPALSEFPSYVFYNGSLQNGVTLKEREYPLKDFPWPNPKCPMFFYNCTGVEEMSASGTSYLNRNEAYMMEKIARALLKNGLKPSQIGVITPYEGQRAYITSLFQRNMSCQQSFEIEVASVDAFQGREKDFILLSCVRSNKKLGIGFLNDARRLNVALTRAKFGLIICGNANVLAKHQTFSKQKSSGGEENIVMNSVWVNLLTQFKKKDLIVDGCLSKLKPSVVNIPAMPISTKFPDYNTLIQEANRTKAKKNTTLDHHKKRKGQGADLSYMSGSQIQNALSMTNSNMRLDMYRQNVNKKREDRYDLYAHMNNSNYSHCSENMLNKEIFNYFTKKNDKFACGGTYVNNRSQLSQYNDLIEGGRFQQDSKNFDNLSVNSNALNQAAMSFYQMRNEFGGSGGRTGSVDLNRKGPFDNQSRNSNYVKGVPSNSRNYLPKNYDMFYPYMLYYRNGNQECGGAPYIYFNDKNEMNPLHGSKLRKNIHSGGSPLMNQINMIMSDRYNQSTLPNRMSEDGSLNLDESKFGYEGSYPISQFSQNDSCG